MDVLAVAAIAIGMLLVAGGLWLRMRRIEDVAAELERRFEHNVAGDRVQQSRIETLEADVEKMRR